MILIAYFWGDQYGVGGKRSKYLYNMLSNHNINVKVIHKDTYGKVGAISKFYWIRKCLCDLCKKKKQQIYISCGPFWHLLPITLLSLIMRHKLYVDFRDGWSLNIKNGYGRGFRGGKNYIELWMSMAIELISYKISEKFITCTPGEYCAYKNMFCDDEKIMLVTNGHELSKEQLERYSFVKKMDSSYKIVCMGKFLGDAINGKENIDKLLRYCSELMIDFHIYFLGTDEETKSVFYGMDNITFLNRMPYDEAIEFIADADLAITAIRDETVDFGTKVFDYIALGIPIYDWFDHEKNFYKYFHDYLFNDISKNNRYSSDFKGVFSRENAMKDLCTVLMLGERQ